MAAISDFDTAAEVGREVGRELLLVLTLVGSYLLLTASLRLPRPKVPPSKLAAVGRGAAVGGAAAAPPAQRRWLSSCGSMAAPPSELAELASTGQLCDVEWVAQRVARLGNEEAVAFYHSALAAGLDLVSADAKQCHQLFRSLVLGNVRSPSGVALVPQFFEEYQRAKGLDLELLACASKMMTARRLPQELLQVYAVVETELLKAEIVDKSVWSCLFWCAHEERAYRQCILFFHRLCKTDGAISFEYAMMQRVAQALSDWELALWLVREMRCRGFETDSTVLNVALSTCVAEEQAAQARTLLQEIREAGRSIGVVSYNTVMKGLADSADMASCEQVYRHLHADGVAPTLVTFSILIDGYINANQIDEALAVSDWMLSAGVGVNAVLCTNILQGFVKHGRLDKAMDMFNDMCMHEWTKPDLVTFSVLIKANCEAGKMEASMRLFERIREFELEPNDIIYNNMLLGCALAGNPALAKEIFRAMVTTGIVPTTATYSILIRLYQEYEDHAAAIELLRSDAPKHGVTLEARVYQQLVNVCLRHRLGSKALEVYELLCERSPGSCDVIGSLLTAAMRLNMFDTAIRFLCAGASMGVVIPEVQAHTVLAAARKRNSVHVDECVLALRVMGWSTEATDGDADLKLLRRGRTSKRSGAKEKPQ